MDSDIEDMIIVAASSILLKENTKKKRKYRINPYLRDRNNKGRFVSDFDDLIFTNHMFYENFHMDVGAFEKLLNIVGPYLEPKKTSWGSLAITPKQKLAAFLEFAASGDLQRHVASCYRISKQHLGPIIDMVCDAILVELKSEIGPIDKNKYLKISNEFFEKWNFPNCIGAIDGKHIAIQAPMNSGSLFYNYKGFHSIVLLASCDAKYKFTNIDVGAYGSEGDSGVFRNSKFGTSIITEKEDFPEDVNLNGIKTPFFYVGDDAFPLGKRILKPYPGKNLSKEEIIFNYRLSRARRCSENAFGILCARWQCLKRTLFCSPDRAQKIASACSLLHNFLMNNASATYCPPGFGDRLNEDGMVVEGEWRNIITTNICSMRPHLGRTSDIGRIVRNNVKNYVNSPEGQVPWQNKNAYI